jgi:hypothetical protein
LKFGQTLELVDERGLVHITRKSAFVRVEVLNKSVNGISDERVSFVVSGGVEEFLCQLFQVLFVRRL